jgi:ribosomal protein L32
MEVGRLPKVSGRKENEIRQKKKQIVEAVKKAIDSIIAKADNKEPLRDEDLRFLKTAMKEWPALEESLAETKEDIGLPEGRLKEFIERLVVLQEVGSLEQIIAATDYYRCPSCGELHVRQRPCMYEEFKARKEEKGS